MPILASSGDSFTEVSFTLVAWVLNFVATLAGLFISLYLLISHDDLQSSFIEPVELSNNLNSVSADDDDHRLIVPPDRIHMQRRLPSLHAFHSALVRHAVQRAASCVECAAVPEEGAPPVFHNEEGIPKGVREHGEPVQVQVHLLRGAHCGFPSRYDTRTH